MRNIIALTNNVQDDSDEYYEVTIVVFDHFNFIEFCTYYIYRNVTNFQIGTSMWLGKLVSHSICLIERIGLYYILREFTITIARNFLFFPPSHSTCTRNAFSSVLTQHVHMCTGYLKINEYFLKLRIS